MARSLAFAALLLGGTVPLVAAEPDTIIVTAPGNDADVDDAITVDADALRRAGPPDVLRALSPGAPRRFLMGLRVDF